MIEGKFTNLFLSQRNKSPLKNVSSFSGLQYWSAFLADFCGVEGVQIVSATFCIWAFLFSLMVLASSGTLSFCDSFFALEVLVISATIVSKLHIVVLLLSSWSEVQGSIICLLFAAFLRITPSAEITFTTESGWDYRWLLLLLWVCKFFQIQKWAQQWTG